MIDKFFEAQVTNHSEKKEMISRKNFQTLLALRLYDAYSAEELENVITKTSDQFHTSRKERMFVHDLVQGMYTDDKLSLDAKKSYIYREFPKYFLTN